MSRPISLARLALLASLLFSLLFSAACATLAPDLVEHRTYQSVHDVHKIAVVPFYPHARLSRASEGSDTSAGDAAALVTRFVTEAIEQRAVEVIPETDVRLAFEGQGQVVPRQAPEAVALLVTADFGADAVLLGEVRRYREREGSSYGSMAPASVEFQVTLYGAPDATRLWTARFDQTQTSLLGNFFQSARYPSSGTRFLSVAELTRFGAELIAEELPLGR